ncbi:MAG: hypothetical protein LIO42_01505 [Oscillospiraceae bacterium]|nr:hypothetical protein [Oscillospiraceae bacterium]
MKKLTYNEQAENLINITCVFQNCVEKYPQLTEIDSDVWNQEFVAWANEFEEMYSDPEFWGNADYFDAIGTFARKKILEFGGFAVPLTEQTAQKN